MGDGRLVGKEVTKRVSNFNIFGERKKVQAPKANEETVMSTE